MLERPSIPNEKIAACLQAGFGLRVESLTFLPVGADLNTAVYRAVAADGTLDFVKLRRGTFDEMSVTVPKFLYDQGITQVIPPLETLSGSLWAELDPFRVILYPYMDGHDGYEVEPSPAQWADLGRAVKRLHTLDVPADLSRRIRRESWSPVHRESLRVVMDNLGSYGGSDSLSLKLVEYLKEKRGLILDLIDHAGRLAHSLQDRSLDYCLCHGDLHAGNLLIHAKGDFYIVDWDDLMLAPREKDLMSVGAALFGGWCSPAEEEELFYRGYGPAQIDRTALTYYRCERIIFDLEVECRQIFRSEGSEDDRQQAFRYLQSNFLPGNTIALARQGDLDWQDG